MSERDHVIESSAAYALGALGPGDARAVDEHCSQCPECAADVAEMRGVASVLPLACAGTTPAADLKRRILSIARGDLAADAFLRDPARRRPVVATTWWAAAAAVFFVAAVGLGSSAYVDHVRMSAQVAQMQSQVASAEARSAAMTLQLSAARGMFADIVGGRVWDMSGGTKNHWWHCTIVQPPKQRKAMLLAMMPTAPKGKTFQAWIIHGGAPHNAGVVAAGKSSMMHIPMPVQSGDVVAFTMEQVGGSSTPTMPYVMEQMLD